MSYKRFSSNSPSYRRKSVQPLLSGKSHETRDWQGFLFFVLKIKYSCLWHLSALPYRTVWGASLQFFFHSYWNQHEITVDFGGNRIYTKFNWLFSWKFTRILSLLKTSFLSYAEFSINLKSCIFPHYHVFREILDLPDLIKPVVHLG